MRRFTFAGGVIFPTLGLILPLNFTVRIRSMSRNSSATQRVTIMVNYCQVRSLESGVKFSGMFCAGELGEGLKDACDRDTGGPALNSR